MTIDITNTNNDLNFLNSILQKIALHIEAHYNNDIISNIEYKKALEDINYVKDFINNNFSVSNDILLSLSKIRLLLIDIVLQYGSCNIYDIINLIMIRYNLSDKYKSILDIFQLYFKVIKVELYDEEKEGSINYKQNVFNKKIKPSNLQLTSSQIDLPSMSKWTHSSNKNILLKCQSSRLIIPLNKSLLVLYGYCNMDHLNTFHNHLCFQTKWTQIVNLFNNLDVPDNFKDNYLNTISFRDFNINIPSQIATDCIQAYAELQKIKSKTISNLIKDISIYDIDKQRNIIMYLYMDSEDKDSVYLSNILYDIITTDNQNKSINLLFSTIHWRLQKISKEYRQKMITINSNLSKFNEETMPYDKRIQLMKANDSVKRRAMEKLKEINNSNNGESKGKAQQYLDGLLRIPFGIYKKEVIRVKFEELKSRYDKFIISITKDLSEAEENNTLSDIDLVNTENLSQLISQYDCNKYNPIMIERLIKNINNWVNNIKNQTVQLNNIYDVDSLKKQLTRVKKKDLINICNTFNIKPNEKKNIIIKNILNHNYNVSNIIELKKNNLELNPQFKELYNTEQFINISQTIDQMNILWNKYQDYQYKYFNELSSRLDNAVHGLDDAKRQIKRLLAQWINGNDHGYVFGFEGPPGTGKTTLAKQGIAKSLKDENGNPRPFVFIALGGSSNGSTLEGHNYTYVGSTWGRIIDGIMESKCMNPIIYIDELDKISKTEHGKELVGILTHMTDPAQNSEFTDKYFSGIKFDISKCLIIFSYNDPELIDKILLDRIQRIKIEPLNSIDKIHVAEDHIITEILDNIGMSNDDIKLERDILNYIIDTYTLEAGARKLKERLYEIYREINLKYLMNDNIELPYNITKEFIDKVFEKNYKVTIKKIHSSPQVGLANGMYANSAGKGGITQVQCYKMPSDKHLELKLTGSMGDDMKESVSVAKSLALRLIPNDIYNEVINIANNDKFGIHVHCPELSTPKSGPSATLVFTIAILSLLLDHPVRNDVAMTGESSLIGKADRIGGVSYKLHGSKAAGVRVALLPRSNEEDLIIIRNGNNPVEDETFEVRLIDNIYDAVEYMMVDGILIRERLNRLE
jgi:ATP-dependent Lon protease